MSDAIWKEHVPAPIEPFIVQDIFASGIAAIEDVGGGCVRLVFYVNVKSSGFLGASADRIVTAKIILTGESAGDTATQIALKLAERDGHRAGACELN